MLASVPRELKEVWGKWARGGLLILSSVVEHWLLDFDFRFLFRFESLQTQGRVSSFFSAEKSEE